LIRRQRIGNSRGIAARDGAIQGGGMGHAGTVRVEADRPAGAVPLDLRDGSTAGHMRGNSDQSAARIDQRDSASRSISIFHVSSCTSLCMGRPAAVRGRAKGLKNRDFSDLSRVLLPSAPVDNGPGGGDG